MEFSRDDNFALGITECEVVMSTERLDDFTSVTQLPSYALCRDLSSRFQELYHLHDQSYLLEAEDVFNCIQEDNILTLESPNILITYEVPGTDCTDDKVCLVTVNGPINVSYICIAPDRDVFQDIDTFEEYNYAGPHIICYFDMPTNDRLPAGRYFGSIVLSSAVVSPSHKPRVFN